MSRPAAPPDTPLGPARYWMTLGGIVLAGALVRILAARGELWLDEIWSLRLAQMLTTPLGVFTELHHDNNHHLNTLYLSIVPASGTWMLYRLHSLAAGIGSIVLAAALARRHGDRAALAAAALTSGSFLLILYSSEARGYALAVFFALLAVALTDRFISSRRMGWGIAAALACVLGLLSHLTFLHAYAGLVAWSVYRLWTGRAREGRWTTLATLHALPLIALGALYWVDLRVMVIGGGPETTAAEIAARAMSLALGGPQGGAFRPVAVAVTLVACLASIAAVRRAGSDLWVLFAVTTVAAPALTLVLTDSSVLFERYFLVAIAFFLVAASWLVADVARRSVAIAAVLVVAFLGANAVQVWRLLDLGRGRYVPAMTQMIQAATHQPVTVASDHDFRHNGVLEFYRDFVAGGETIRYVPRQSQASAAPDWMLVHSQAPDFTPAADLTTIWGSRYALATHYRSAPLSGWHLGVYRKKE